MMGKDHIQPVDFPDRIIFMSTHGNIHWCQKCNEESCKAILSRGGMSFFRPGSGEKWCATLAHELHGLRRKVAEEMSMFFAESGHPVFRGTSALSS